MIITKTAEEYTFVEGENKAVATIYPKAKHFSILRVHVVDESFVNRISSGINTYMRTNSLEININ